MSTRTEMQRWRPWFDQSSLWRKARLGKFWKRCLHKAERAWARGRRRSRSVAHYASTVNWKDS